MQVILAPVQQDSKYGRPQLRTKRRRDHPVQIISERLVQNSKLSTVFGHAKIVELGIGTEWISYMSTLRTNMKGGKKIVGPDDPYQAEDSVGLHDLLAAHFLLIDYFVEKKYAFGGIGPKNLDLLHSALSRQFTDSYAGINKWNGLFENCATLMFGLIMNHPFHDANKRTALLSVLSLLHRKKHIITLQQKKLDSLVVAVAANDLQLYFGKDARYKKSLQLISKSNADETVRILADFLRRNTRYRDDSCPRCDLQ